jgi:hypothetical protein
MGLLKGIGVPILRRGDAAGEWVGEWRIRRRTGEFDLRHNADMTGIQYVSDEQGRRIAVQIDLRVHGELWEDLQDVLVSRKRQSEKSIPLEDFKSQLVKSGKLSESL